jgi:hypothetical protein
VQSGRHGGAASNAAVVAVVSRGRSAILSIVAFTIAASVLPVSPQLTSTSTIASTSATASVRPVAGGWAETVHAWLGPVAHWYRPVTIRLKPRPAQGAFSMNLFSRDDFVHQQTEYWCVAAAVQTMANIIGDGIPDRSRRLQERLHFMGRRLDREGDEYWRELAGQHRWRRGLHGLGLDDWAGMLNAGATGRNRSSVPSRASKPSVWRPGPSA